MDNIKTTTKDGLKNELMEIYAEMIDTLEPEELMQPMAQVAWNHFVQDISEEDYEAVVEENPDLDSDIAVAVVRFLKMLNKSIVEINIDELTDVMWTIYVKALKEPDE